MFYRIGPGVLKFGKNARSRNIFHLSSDLKFSSLVLCSALVELIQADGDGFEIVKIFQPNLSLLSQFPHKQHS